MTSSLTPKRVGFLLGNRDQCSSSFSRAESLQIAILATIQSQLPSAASISSMFRCFFCASARTNQAGTAGQQTTKANLIVVAAGLSQTDLSPLMDGNPKLQANLRKDTRDATELLKNVTQSGRKLRKVVVDTADAPNSPGKPTGKHPASCSGCHEQRLSHTLVCLLFLKIATASLVFI